LPKANGENSKSPGFSKTIRHVFSVYQESDALNAMTACADASCCQWAVWLVSPLAAL
jgi:hypothetical protein